VDRTRLETELERHFGGDERTRQLISRQARDLAESGMLETDGGYELTVETVIDHLADAPAGHTLVDRWNWWIGSLDVAFGGYDQFRVRTDLLR
jgi:hypothetical protein